MLKRLDQWLVDLQLAPTKTKAKDLILSGAVFLGEKALLKPGATYQESELQNLRVNASSVLKFVSRGGLKLEGALTKIALDVNGLIALDIGSSTGGFSDCLLQKGAKWVVGFDVGHDQIHKDLLRNPNFKNFEGVHFAETQKNPELVSYLKKGFDLIVADISFVSLEKLFPFVKEWLRPEGKLLFLVKPQFELSAKDLNKKGVVKNESLLDEVKLKLYALAQDKGFKVLDYFPSSLEGKEGNKEFFIYCSGQI